MSLILNIDTSATTAQINIAENGLIVQEEKNTNQKDHASFVQPAIQSLIKKSGITLNDIASIAVACGPGSYTGLRVGMASAKGLCFALDKPMITVGSLEILARAAIDQYQQNDMEGTFFCPMIDARRMEVFTAIYDSRLNSILAPCALILNSGFVVKELLNSRIAFFGDGAAKWQTICPNEKALFLNVPDNGLAMSKLSFKKFVDKDFADTAYAEPLYLKEFYLAQNIR